MVSAESNAMEKHEVVISGVGGQFPDCNSVEELQKSLFDKVNLVSSDDRRWSPGELGVPAAIGKLKEIDTFDTTFFGIHRKLCENLDGLTRMSMERAYEAVVDAGVNPTELYGTDTAVMMASCISESEFVTIFDTKSDGFGILGHNRSMQANRISYMLNLTGPSFSMDSTWIGGMQCLQGAYEMVADGHCNSALVGIANLALHPNISLQFLGMGKLNYDGQTKSFSSDADGYTRAEACVVFFLQRKQDAKRSYGTIVNISTTVIGDRPGTYLQNTSDGFRTFLKECYREAGIDPSTVAFLEADGSGVQPVDAIELNVVDEVMCRNRIKPLLIGAIKSNIGHTEAAASLASIVKALIALDQGVIPPNINYTSPNPDVPALLEGRMEVVTEARPLEGDLVAVTTFGLTGGFAHLILRQNPKGKEVKKEPVDLDTTSDIPEKLPRLFIASARDESEITRILNKVDSMPRDEEFLTLTNHVFTRDIQGHLYRGYSVIPNSGTPQRESMCVSGGKRRPIWFIFSGMGSQWTGMGSHLLQFPIFAAAIEKCQNILKPKGVDVIDIITSVNPNIFDNILNSFVGIAAIQIGLVDLLFTLGIRPDGIVGHSVGELGCAYADGCFTAEEMILSAYARGRASIETELIKGKMAAVGMGYQQIKDEIPESIEVACHNSVESCTLSGPAEDMEVYIEQLKNRKVFAKLVNVANIAYHSRYIAPAAPALLNYLKEVITESKPRSEKWISSSVPEKDWDTPLAKLSSPEYHTNNLLSSVLFEEASKHIPENAICIEIAPHGLLQAVLRRSLAKDCTNIPLTQRAHKNGVGFFLEAIGNLYMNGLLPEINKLYPPIEFPVSRGTPPLAELVSWDHSERWNTANMVLPLGKIPGERIIKINLNDVKDQFFLDHNIRNRWILPASSFLYFAWESLMLVTKEMAIVKPVVFENVRFHHVAEIDKKSTIHQMYILLQRGSGNWEICLDDTLIASGIIREVQQLYDKLDEQFSEENMLKFIETEKDVSFSQDDVYRVFEEIGYEQKDGFQTIKNLTLNEHGLKGEIMFDDNWTQFLDGILKLHVFERAEKTNQLYLPSFFQRLVIKPSEFEAGKAVNFVLNYNTNILTAPGIKMYGAKPDIGTITPYGNTQLRLEEYKFIPHASPNLQSLDQLLNVCVQLVFENVIQVQSNCKSISVLELENYTNLPPLSPHIQAAVKKRSDIQINFLPTCGSDIDEILELKNKQPSPLLIISRENVLNKALLILDKDKEGFILASCSPDTDLSPKAGFKVLLEQQFGRNKIILLKKTVTSVTRPWSVVYTSNPDWSEELSTLKSSLSTKTDSIIYLVVCGEPLIGIPSFIKAVDSNQIRYVILLDENCPKFSPTLSFYAEQLALDLKINLYKDGRWGTYRKFMVKEDIMPESEPLSSLTVLSNLSSEEVEAHYLGYNYRDHTVTKENDYNYELGHLDYSGVSRSNGQRVMGLAPHQNGMTRLHPDPVLTWRVPSAWSLEDAATVPLAYTLAYYSLIEIGRLNPREAVLIHSGYTTISLAAISIALKNQCTVFTTYSTQDQAEFIKEKFPKLKPEHLLHEDSDFDISIKLETKGLGVDIVLNCLSGTNMQKSVECLGMYARFLHLGQNKKAMQTSIGMWVFLKSTSVYGVTGESLFEFPDWMKQKLKKLVQAGIDDGTVKPFERSVSYGYCTDKGVAKLLRTSDLEHSRKKAVHYVKTEKSKKAISSALKKFVCNAKQSYIVVGGKTPLYIDIVAWLAERGAQNLIVVVDKQALNTITNRRLNTLVARYGNMAVQMITTNDVDSVKDAENVISKAAALGPLDGIFFAATNAENDLIAYFDRASRRLVPRMSAFVSLMSGGSKVWESRRAAGLPCLALHWEKPFTHTSQVLCALDDAIDKESNRQLLLTEYNLDVSTEEDRSSIYLSWHLPGSVDELIAFGRDTVSTAHFKEIRTLSPGYDATKGIAPVFIIPGFKPRQLDTLISRLVYPAFIAKLPVEITSLREIAIELVKELKSLRQMDTYSLVASGWGGLLALDMSLLLEAEGKLATVMLIDAAADTVRNWVMTFKENMDVKLITRYITLTNKDEIDLDESKDWTQRLNVIANNKLKDNDELSSIKVALTALKSRLQVSLDLNYMNFDVLKSANLYLYKPFEDTKNSSYFSLKDFSKKSITVNISEQTDLQGMVDDEQFSRAINNIVQFEYPESSYRIETFKSLNTILKSFKPVWH